MSYDLIVSEIMKIAMSKNVEIFYYVDEPLGTNILEPWTMH
jgi:hypothetical protein